MKWDLWTAVPVPSLNSQKSVLSPRCLFSLTNCAVCLTRLYLCALASLSFHIPTEPVPHIRKDSVPLDFVQLCAEPRNNCRLSISNCSSFLSASRLFEISRGWGGTVPGVNCWVQNERHSRTFLFLDLPFLPLGCCSCPPSVWLLAKPCEAASNWHPTTAWNVPQNLF